MKVARSVGEARQVLAGRAADSVGLVPTMGALHRGHESLLAAARAECAVVVASVFVNPAQFRPEEDFHAYPRDESRDLAVLEAAGADLAFLPSAEEMYPPGFQSWVEVVSLSRGLEGDARPGHFRGVATVCLKLFNAIRPHRAYFGEKDAQQAAVVGRMIRDLHLEIELRVLPTVRDADGLPFSSRNAYLGAAEREAAAALPRALFAGAEAHRSGGDAVAAAREVLAREPRVAPEYVEVAEWEGRTVLAAAVRAGTTRLIDNVLLEARP